MGTGSGIVGEAIKSSSKTGAYAGGMIGAVGGALSAAIYGLPLVSTPGGALLGLPGIVAAGALTAGALGAAALVAPLAFWGLARGLAERKGTAAGIKAAATTMEKLKAASPQVHYAVEAGLKEAGEKGIPWAKRVLAKTVSTMGKTA